MNTREFSPNLQNKIDQLLTKRESKRLGSINIDSKVLLAPMAGICTAPFRLLMQDLGAGVTVSELISCHGINYENKRTLEMLYIDERETNIGLQLFGEDPESFSKAASFVQRYNPKFIDINMGCPVRKVVSKGGGSAMMKDVDSLGEFFGKVKKAIDVPLTIKIRTGWDADDRNAARIEQIAKDEGVEWVAIHGRTRAQQYTGQADWDFIETLAHTSSLPIIGNGDLHQAHQVAYRLQNTDCDGLMIARGCLRNPFIFLESLADEQSTNSLFQGSDYWEVIERLYTYIDQMVTQDRAKLVQLRKLVVWFAAGFPKAAAFRQSMFSSKDIDSTMKVAQEYFKGLGTSYKKINYDEVFMSSGHG